MRLGKLQLWPAILTAAALLCGCDEPGPRVYTAQAFDAAADCLEPYAPIGFVEAKDLDATCEPVCLELEDTLYVSTLCPPYPTETVPQLPEPGSSCAAALAALAAEAYCP